MRVTFDSNAWEKIFEPDDRHWASIRSAIAGGRITGFICEAAFRIEAIRKRERTAYFAEPAMDLQFPFSIVMRDGRPYVQFMSIGPDDASHPGLPEVQSDKLKSALTAGIRLLRGATWLGLPAPAEIRDPAFFVQTNDPDREQRQSSSMHLYRTIPQSLLKGCKRFGGVGHFGQELSPECLLG